MTLRAPPHPHVIPNNLSRPPPPNFQERKHLLCVAIDPEHEDFQQHKQRKRGLSDADFQQMADGSLDVMQDLLKEVETLGREFDAIRDEVREEREESWW